MATSREALGAPEEVVYRVPSLPVPPLDAPADALAGYEAAALFVERARARLPDFAVAPAHAPAIARICVRLDGIPLAIELAAARAGSLAAEAIAARLDDRFRLLTGGPRTALPRQQTLRATVDWSHDLLGPVEQVVLRRLAVFAGGWTEDSAIAVCADPAHDGGRQGTVTGGVCATDVPGALAALVARSLAIQTEEADPRFTMLETIRHYAAERLGAARETEALRRRHLARYVALAESAEPDLRAARQDLALAALEAEHDNLRAALAASLEGADAGVAALHIAGAIWWFWLVRGHLTEGRSWLERALQPRDGEAADATIRGKALVGAGYLAYYQGDYACAASFFSQGRDLAPAVHSREHAGALNGLGLVSWNRCDYAGAGALMRESLDRFREHGDAWGIALALNGLGLVAYDQGRYEDAAALHRQSLALRRASGDRWGLAKALNNLGWVIHELGRFEEAGRLQEASLGIARSIGDRRGSAAALTDLGLALQAQGQLEQAASLLEEALQIYGALGDRWGLAYAGAKLAGVEESRGRGERAAVLYRESLTIYEDLDDRWGIADCLLGQALAAARQGRPREAAALLRDADALRAAIGAPLRPRDRGAHAEAAAAADASLLREDVASAVGRAHAAEARAGCDPT
jgi:predicted ATPase